ncbi:MAG TPA: hypothetical protein VKA38_07425 [Draconibacterium sp.]|nr:hypothetical protein [Draconibacterium sp.]
MKRIETIFVSPPIRPNNGIDAFELLSQNKQIEISNEVIYWFIEELEKNTDFSFYYHINKYNKNWTTLNKLE